MHLCIHTYKYTCTYIYMNSRCAISSTDCSATETDCVCVYDGVCVCTCMQVFVCVCVRVCVCMCVSLFRSEWHALA